MADWPAPARDEIHLWRAQLDVAPALLARLGACLSGVERERSACFRLDRDRSRFVAARGWLRTLLARYLDSAASEIVLAVGPHGKPQLAAGPGWLHFNISHSDLVAVYAVAQGREVGVDVERVCPDFPIDKIAHHYYSPRERAGLAALPESDRLRAGFDCWTRKEAYLKAVGAGLGQPLDEFDFMVRPGEPVYLGNSCADRRRWSVHSFDAGPGFAAAVAVEGGPCSVPYAAQALGPALQTSNAGLYSLGRRSAS